MNNFHQSTVEDGFELSHAVFSATLQPNFTRRKFSGGRAWASFDRLFQRIQFFTPSQCGDGFRPHPLPALRRCEKLDSLEKQPNKARA